MITTSQITSIDPQGGGRAYVRERHTDRAGIAHDVEYLADVDTDYQAVMLARVPEIEAGLRQSELDQIEAMVLDGIPAIDVAPPVYVTPEEVYAYLFTKFSAEPDCTKLLKAAHFMDIFTDAELEGYGLGADLVGRIRAKAGEIQTIAAAINAYIPPMEVV